MSQPIKMDALHPNLVVCPFNCRQHIESLLQHAQTSIIMYQQYIADTNIQKILRAKKDAGIDVKIIL
jgi:phosphatidylserine/phosphatidylglycerophosphate/cardiolipin synthase-like enzyme